MADPKRILGGLGKASKRLTMTDEEKLAQKYAPDVQYADPLKPPSMRMSEALGNVGAEGKTLNFTETDRSRVFGSNRGGVGFAGLQHYSLPHKKANTVWGFGNKNTADKKVKQNDPEKSIWTTFVGSPNQHKSNTVVLKDAMKEFQDAVKAGNVPAGQIKLMNDRIRAAKDDKTGVLLFDDAFDLTDPSALGTANTFSRRSAVGDVLLGEGVKGPMRSKAYKSEYGNEPWRDSGQMDSILRRETDPDLVDAGTYDVGNRFFVLDGKIIERSDLNEAFPLQVTGNDLGIKYQLVPPDKAMRDFYKLREGRKDKNDRPAPVNYYDLSRAEPSQFIDEDFLTFLQKEGYKKGGAVDIKAADARLAAAMGQRMAKGGKVDIEAADARLNAAMAQRMAGGGGAFKKIAFMAGGGSLQDTLKKNQNYSVLDQGAKKPNELSGVVLSGASWLAGDEKTKLANKAFGQDVTNTAVGGYKTADVLNQLNVFERDGGTFAPGTTVVLDIGANDIATGVDPAITRRNLDELVSRLGDSGVQIIMSAQPFANSFQEAIDNPNLVMNEMYSDIASNNPHVTLVDAMSGMLNRKDLMDESGFHLNSDDAKLEYINKFADAFKANNPTTQFETGLPKEIEQVVDTGTAIDIPQEIAQITQVDKPEERYTQEAQVAFTPAVVEREPSAGYNYAIQNQGLDNYYQVINDYLSQERTQDEIQAAMEQYGVSQADVDAARGSGGFKPDESYATAQYAEGGGAFKTLQWAKPQHFDGGGIASPEESSGNETKPFFETQKWSDIKKNAAEMYDEGKKSLASDYDRLKNSSRARAQLAKIAALQLAGGAPDLAHLGIDLVVDPLKSVTVDKLLTKPKYRSVLEGPANPNSPRLEDRPQRVPMFGSLSESLKTADGLPIGGSEHMIKRAQDAGLMSQGRFSPLTEIPAAILGGAGVSKLGKGAVKGYDKLTGANSGKLNPLQPEAMTAPAGTPQGATYATKQEGPFFRVSPTSLDVSGAKSRGLREADELQGQAPVGGTAGQAGSQVPLRISDEEVARLIADPASNQPLQIAQRFTKDTQGADFVKPDIPESSLAKQSAIGRAHQLAVEGSPEYKSSVFDAYAKQMPDVLEQAGAKDYDDLMEKAYRQLAKETDEQFKQLPYNFSYHRAGEGDYLGGSKEMMADVHGNKHLYVFQGGDPHDFLNRMDKASGLNENEKFRAVHDLLGHAIYGNQFGPKGEELAYAVHQQMYSPLARLAMASETRGQNSLVNYSPLNVSLKTNIAKLEDLEVEAMRRGNKDLVNEIRAAKRQEFANNFQFAPQKAVLLPPEFIDPKFAGGLPDYLSAANRPAKGTETQSVLTHFSQSPDLQMLDPKRYGTGIKGAEAERLRDFAGGVKDRSYVYLGEPGTIAPESGLGVNRYRGESSNLYDITKDPLSFRALARESNRTPFTAKVNAGITSPLQEANDYERLVKEYGYEGMINPNASKPMGIMFKPTPVQPRKRGGLTQLRAR
jgi:hypothetical protein